MEDSNEEWDSASISSDDLVSSSDSGDESDLNISENENDGLENQNTSNNIRRGPGRPRKNQPDTTNPNEIWNAIRGRNEHPTRIPFEADTVGFKPPLNPPETELEFFQFFSDELLLNIVNESNRYAKEKIKDAEPVEKTSQWYDWKDITVEEMKAFLGIILNMSINEKPSLKDYFSNDWTLHQPFFAEVITRRRFLQLFRALHVANPISVHEDQCLTRADKINNVCKYIDDACRKYYFPSEDIVVDESTVGFKGRVAFKCYNPKKPTKWGLRVFVLAESQSGYVSAFLPYFGQPTTQSLMRPDLNFSTRVVLQLVSNLQKDFPATGRHLFTDRYYTSCELAKELKAIFIHIIGTVNNNRKGLPHQVCSF